MARKKAKRKSMNKIEPAIYTFVSNTSLVAPGVTEEFTVDLSQMASTLNRRFYRQGLNWAVGGFKFITTTGVSGAIAVEKLPNTWVVSGAWEKTMRTWLKQQNEAIDEAGLQSAVARFRDFKIHMDKTHVDSTFANNLLPVDADGNPYLLGEWNNSLVVVPNSGGVPGNTQEYSVHMIGDDDPAPAQSKGMIKAYAESRSTPQSPDPVSLPGAETSLFVEMFDTGQDQSDIVDNAIDRNDNLPYDQLEYPGGVGNGPTLVTHDLANITGTTVGGMTRMKGGNFPCGLIRIKWQNQSESPANLIFLIDLVPGPHRGYLCQPMTEM
jgi:hypothetical protein